jgi:GNAT superfamily N-acetyltransferase
VKGATCSGGAGADDTGIVFATAELRARELQAGEVPLVQALFDANPGYFQIVNHRPAGPDEAQCEFDEVPPPHLSWSRRWFLGLFLPDGTLVGLTIVVSDLCAPRVWHLALLLLATRLHGQGVAQRGYDALEAWVRAEGAHWLRLGVVRANTRARRFWQRQGFHDLRRRDGVDTGGHLNDLFTCCKPLAGGSVDEYLALVPRDAPGSILP